MNDETALYQRLRENEETAKKFYEVEKKILSILRFKDLFDALLTEIKGQFNLPYVWLSIIENSEAHHLIESIDDMDPELKASINIIDRSAFFALIGRQTEPILANDGLKPFFKLLPADRHYLVKSMAIAPIMMDREIVGSLNHGDAAQDRFEPGMDTSLLEQLATKVSLCLSNVAAHEKLKFLAYHDPLTGLLNRRVMETALARETARAGRYNLPLSVVFLDLDYFKKVNDTHGHETGDALLKHLADQLVHQCRGTDIVARFAGDEFVLILPETDAGHATALMHRIQKHLAASPLVCGETAIPVVITFGVASAMDPDFQGNDPAALLKKADERLYEKKAARQNKEGRA
ncbi:MAG: sensor domain-containing diguanylate cyclase [Thermodesulfobacteriota bacterium]|nr:sensor domain-containing diguanylate cyclase [Thermodesulfobacteriota bacterium]